MKNNLTSIMGAHTVHYAQGQKYPKAGTASSALLHSARGNLQRPYDNQIMTPHHLFLFAKADMKSSVNFYFTTTEKYEQELALLSSSLLELTNSTAFVLCSEVF